ncbi:MAG: tRNA (adenosine(37)-N6)-dimethylallyltransferase MiaA [Desulfatiglandaceae bacterium]
MNCISDTTPLRAKCIVIAGPTASGKTAFAVELARHLSGEIVNADSMQIYRGMDVGTAKPDDAEKQGVPHHLLDVVAPDEPFNAAVYRRLAFPVVMDICSRKKSCLVVGGTGLYIKALLGGLMTAPSSDSGLRDRLRAECDALGTSHLHARLARLDPAYAQNVHPNDRVRIIRGLEIIQLTGQIPSQLMQTHGFTDRTLKCLKIGLHVDRKLLYDRIDKRTEDMVEKGLVQETQALLKKGYSPDLKSMKAIGYRHMIRYLKGTCTLGEATERLKRDTRRYAKRQMTWFRADPDTIWMAPDAIETALTRIKAFLSETT